MGRQTTARNYSPLDSAEIAKAMVSFIRAADRWKRYDRAALKLAEKMGLSLPVAQTIADQNGFGRRR